MWSLKTEEGSLLVEALVAIVAITVIFTSLVAAYKNISPVKDVLSISESFNTLRTVKVIEAISPKIASTLDIGEGIIVNSDGPEYLPNDKYRYYLNYYQDYGKTVPPTEPLTLANYIQTKYTFTLTRTDSNRFNCDVIIVSQDFTKLSLIPESLTGLGVVTLKGETSIKIPKGREYEYSYSFSGDIVKGVTYEE